MKKAEYRNAARSRRLICDALMELLDEKPLDKITVTDIANRADISRGTFYLHYDSVGEVISELQDAFIEQMDAYFVSLDIPFSVDNIAVLTIECLKYIYMQNNGKYLALIYHQQVSFADKISQNLQKQILESRDIPQDEEVQKKILVRAGLLIHGMIGIFRAMSNKSLDISIEHLIEGIDDLTSDLRELQTHKDRKEKKK